MSALLLSNYLQNREEGRGVKIALIESPNIPTVGVGEATVPGMPRTLRGAGISEREFMKTCNASFKLGVMFDRWNNDAAGNPIAYVNPFNPPPSIGGIDMAAYYLKYGGGGLDFVQLMSPAVDLGRSAKGPRPLKAQEYAKGIGFAYHLDAGLFAGMLRDTCIKRGVEHILDDMQDVELDERGYVAALNLKERGRHEVELVIDCTGFRGLIINQALGTEFESYSKYLANDRAMAVQVAHPKGGKLEPMTRSTALGAGWTWRVPLFNRIGTGYVFSSAHRTDEEARKEFLEWLGPLGEGAEPRVIPMRIGRSKQAWVKNCVAVGLSGGFIEPLESTAIHMIDMAIRWLITYFPDTSFPEPVRDRYNKITAKSYAEVRDFICLHYALNNRTDSQYWIDAREELEVPDSLAENLEVWRYNLPGHYDLDFQVLFSTSTYQTVLLGKQVYENGFGAPSFGAGLQLNPDRWQEHVAKTRSYVKSFVSRSADHRTLLKELRGELQPQQANQPWALTGGAMPTVAVPGTKQPPVKVKLQPAAQSDDQANLL